MRQNLPLEIIAGICLLILIILPIIFYPNLPDIIPIHYGADGKADGFGAKHTIFLLPVVGVLLYVGLTYLNRYPHHFNYPHRITPENKEKSYRTAQSMISALKTLITIIFTYITYITISSAGSDTASLGAFFLPLTAFMILGLLGYYTIMMLKK